LKPGSFIKLSFGKGILELIQAKKKILTDE